MIDDWRLMIEEPKKIDDLKNSNGETANRRNGEKDLSPLHRLSDSFWVECVFFNQQSSQDLLRH
jgi:hypothetical protein